MGLYGILVVTTAPAGATAGTAYPASGTAAAVTYNAEVPLLFSEIDLAQNKAVSAAVSTPGFSEDATIGPFFNTPVGMVAVTNGGTGYTSAPTVTFSPAGAAATAVIDNVPASPTFGQVTEIDIISGGNYSGTPPTVTISGGGGTGATATASSNSLRIAWQGIAAVERPHVIRRP